MERLNLSRDIDETLAWLHDSRHVGHELWHGDDFHHRPQPADGVLVINAKGHIRFANAAAERILLAPTGSLKGRKFGFPLREGFTLVDVHNGSQGLTTAVLHCSHIPRKRRTEYLVTLRLQAAAPALSAAAKGDRPAADPLAPLSHPLAPALSRHHGEHASRSELLQKLTHHSPFGIVVVNLSGKVTVWSKAATQILGWSAHDMLGHPLPDTVATSGDSLSELWQRTLQGESIAGEALFSQKRDDGRLVDLKVWSVLMRNAQGLPAGALLMLADVTRERRIQANLRHVVDHDALTGLPHRQQFRKQLHRTLRNRKKVGEQHLIVLVMGIDRFKAINKSLGREEGDFLLQQIVERLRDALYETDLIARTGGDEFSIMLRDTRHIRDASRVADKLLDCFTDAFELRGRSIYVTASIGIAVAPVDGHTPKALMHAAEAAMERSKERGGNCSNFYARHMDEQALAQLYLEQELHFALERGQLYLDYQPQWDLRSGQLRGVEALLRWRHPQLGLISPAAFIPLADSTGLIAAIGAWVLREACLQLRRWAKLYPAASLRMSVNVSPRQFDSGTLEDDVAEAIAMSGIAPAQLELEITESMMAKDVAAVALILKNLRTQGVRVAIDDFGTGYSSLAYLADLPIDTLKIDQSFVRPLESKPGCKAIIASVMALARGLGLQVIAEGVETPTQLAYLRQVGCDEGQGFLMARPLSPARVATLFGQPSPLSGLEPAAAPDCVAD